MLLCSESKPYRSLSDRRFLVGEKVLLAIGARGRSGLLDVCEERFASLESLIRIDWDHGIGLLLCDCRGGGHVCELTFCGDTGSDYQGADDFSSVLLVEVGNFALSGDWFFRLSLIT